MVAGLVMTMYFWGCIPIQSSPQSRRSQIHVIPYSTSHAIALAAVDVVSIMRAANFTDQQIYEFGSQIRTALMTVGGAQIQISSAKEAKVAVQFVVNDDDYVLVNSLASGYFVYDARNHKFGLRTPPQNQQLPIPTPAQ